jgi:hypothetical protein
MAIPVAPSSLGSAAVSSNPDDPQPGAVENKSHVPFSRLRIFARKSILLLAVTLSCCLACLYAGSSGIGSWRDYYRNHVELIKLLHHCSVLYRTFTDGESIWYDRHFKIPCGYSLLVFNVGPAQDYQPFKYDINDDGDGFYVHDDQNFI